jgi:putative membrane protein
MTFYLFIKFLHIVAIICWMAGLFYLPRLYVYHSGVSVGSDQDRLFQIMEAKLLKIIMHPSMIISFATGFYLSQSFGSHNGPIWLHIKFVATIFMAIFHFYLCKIRVIFINGQNDKSHKFYRMINEVPTILMLIIVFMVVVRPWI